MGIINADLILVEAVGSIADVLSPDQINVAGRGVKLVLDMTVNAGGLGSVTLILEGRDLASGKYYTLLSGLAVVTVSKNIYTLYPGIPAANNVSVNDILPHIWRVRGSTGGNVNPTTFTIGASVIL